MMSEMLRVETTSGWRAGSVGEAMTREVPVVGTGTRADLAARRLGAWQGCALVTDAAGRLVGAVTLGELLCPFGPGIVGAAVREPWHLHEQGLSCFHVDELMDAAKPVTLTADAPLLVAFELMEGTRSDWLAVTDSAGHPLGDRHPPERGHDGDRSDAMRRGHALEMVADLVKTDVVVVSASCTVAEAVATLGEGHVSVAPVGR